MKGNPYWNTIWTDRDGEFYWSGVKIGALISAIMVPCTYMVVRVLIDEFKNL